MDAVMKDIDDVCNEECRDRVLDSEDDQENIAKLRDSQVGNELLRIRYLLVDYTLEIGDLTYCYDHKITLMYPLHRMR